MRLPRGRTASPEAADPPALVLDSHGAHPPSCASLAAASSRPVLSGKMAKGVASCKGVTLGRHRRIEFDPLGRTCNLKSRFETWLFLTDPLLSRALDQKAQSESELSILANEKVSYSEADEMTFGAAALDDDTLEVTRQRTCTPPSPPPPRPSASPRLPAPRRRAPRPSSAPPKTASPSPRSPDYGGRCSAGRQGRSQAEDYQVPGRAQGPEEGEREEGGGEGGRLRDHVSLRCDPRLARAETRTPRLGFPNAIRHYF